MSSCVRAFGTLLEEQLTETEAPYGQTVQKRSRGSERELDVSA